MVDHGMIVVLFFSTSLQSIFILYRGLPMNIFTRGGGDALIFPLSSTWKILFSKVQWKKDQKTQHFSKQKTFLFTDRRTFARLIEKQMKSVITNKLFLWQKGDVTWKLLNAVWLEGNTPFYPLQIPQSNTER